MTWEENAHSWKSEINLESQQKIINPIPKTLPPPEQRNLFSDGKMIALRDRYGWMFGNNDIRKKEKEETKLQHNL